MAASRSCHALGSRQVERGHVEGQPRVDVLVEHLQHVAYAGNGGAGGSGGFIDVVGTPNMTLFGSLNAAGGTGGAGGAGSASVAGGNGGAGGSAGAVFLDASSATGTQTGDGIIFVLAGSSPFTVSVNEMAR